MGTQVPLGEGWKPPAQSTFSVPMDIANIHDNNNAIPDWRSLRPCKGLRCARVLGLNLFSYRGSPSEPLGRTKLLKSYPWKSGGGTKVPLTVPWNFKRSPKITRTVPSTLPGKTGPSFIPCPPIGTPSCTRRTFKPFASPIAYPNQTRPPEHGSCRRRQATIIKPSLEPILFVLRYSHLL